MSCRKPTRQNPNGRTGTQAGWKAHERAEEPVCDQCRDARNEYQRSRDHYYMWNRYGLTVERYEAMLVEQFGGCAICGATQPGGPGRFHVDHDHACCSGEKTCGDCVRGLLCSNCNRGLGYFADNVERMRLAIRYIEGSKK